MRNKQGGVLVFFPCVANRRRTSIQEISMNNDRVEGNWKQFKGKLKEQWGKLTDDDFKVIEGNREQLMGRVQERYGIARDEAEKQVKKFRDSNRDLYS
jgi:uncharacterized protein YjbJ (UPF0337 family)